MKKFILKLFLVCTPFLLFYFISIILPTTPRASKSLLISINKKDSLLENSPSPRIIFVGGSNLSFGLNSQMIRDSLGINPINTAIHASIGLKFMLDNTIQYIRKNDIVILAPEYSHYYRNINFGSQELFRTIFDANISKIKLLNVYQLFNLFPFVHKYAISKFKKSEYVNVIESDVYSVNSFNEYGDVYKHWELKKTDFNPYMSISGDFNNSIIDELNKFKSKILEKGAVLLITYPAFQSTSYDNSVEEITKIEIELKKNDFIILGTSKRYKMPDSLMFNTPYHLSKEGVDLRTRLLIEDLKRELDF